MPQVEVVLDELDASATPWPGPTPGDLVVLCADNHATVLAELEERTKSAQAGSRPQGPGQPVSDPDLDPSSLTETAEAEGTEAEDEALSSLPTEGRPVPADDTAI